MSTPLEQLGQRVATCRQQAGLDVATLSQRARVPEAQLREFERGNGGLALAALSRLARVLGVPTGTFLHTDALPARAYKAPSVLLKTWRTADLSEVEQEALAGMLERARAFATLGELLWTERLSARFQPSPAPKQKPYLAGYTAALEARRLLPEREGAIRDLSRLVENRFDIFVVQHSFSSGAVLGAACRSGQARLIALSASMPTEAQRRFVLAHELAHHLLDFDEEGVSLDQGQVEEAGWWLENPPHEKRANAFAAMFLAPDFAVRRVLGEPRPEGYGLADAQQLVSTAQAHFGISFAAMAWHLLNLRYLRDDATVRALLQAPPGSSPTEFESPSRFHGLERRVFEALERDQISEERARELLGGPIPQHEPW